MLRYKVFYSILMLTLVFFTSSCKKEMSSNGGATEVIFEVGGIEDALELKASTSELLKEEAKSTLESRLPITTVKLNSGFEIETYKNQDEMESLLDKMSEVDVKISKLASTSPMELGKTFRIMMRKVGTSNWVLNNQVVVGNKVNVIVEAGGEYEYIAYSYNDNTTIPDPLVSNNFNISTEQNRDLLHAKKTFTAVAGSNKEKIHFTHKVALISLNLDMSMFASMVPSTGVEAELADISYNVANSSKDGKLFTSTLDLLTGSLSAPIAYSPGVVFNEVIPSNAGERVNNFYSTNVNGLESIKLRLKKFIVSDGASVNTDLVAAEGVSHLDFNYDFRPAAGRPVIDLGHRLRADLLLLKPLPRMYVLSADTLYYNQYFASATSWHMLSYYTPGAPISSGYNGAPNMTNLSGVQTQWLYGNRFESTGASGFMAVNFAKDYTGATPSLSDLNKKFYVKGKVKVIDDFYYDFFETQTLGAGSTGRGQVYNFTLDKQLTAPWRSRPSDIVSKTSRPDVIILSLQTVTLNNADNLALIDYVKNKKGTVILMADRSDMRTPTLTNPNKDRSVLPFVRAIFGSDKDDTSIDMDRLLTTHSPNDGTKHTFKLNPNLINDPVMNGFYGYVGDNYWLSVGDISYITGINDANIINYSDNQPDGGSGLPSDARIMFRHKQHNVFYIGDSQFIFNSTTVTNFNNPGYSVSTSSDNNYTNWRAPLTATYSGKKVDNAKIFGNFMVYSLVREAIKQSNP